MTDAYTNPRLVKLRFFAHSTTFFPANSTMAASSCTTPTIRYSGLFAAWFVCWLTGPQLLEAFQQLPDPKPEPARAVSVLVQTPADKPAEESADGSNVQQASGEQPLGDLAAAAVAEKVAAVRFQPTSFAELIPGVSTEARVKEVLGEPRLSLQQGERWIQTYMLEPYERVGVVMHADLLESIHLHLAKTLPVTEFISQLELPPAEGVNRQLSSTGTTQRIFPERGVSLTCQEQDGQAYVTQVSFHPIRELDFLQAAQQLEYSQFTRALQLARYAQQLKPESTAAIAAEARVLAHTGEYTAALEALGRVTQLAPADLPSQLLQARLWAETGHVSNAIQQVRQLRNSTSTPAILRARAALLLGQLIDQRVDRGVVIQYHEEAIERARQLLPELAGRQRDEALLLLVDAHRSMAGVVAAGDWEAKETATASLRWLEIADKLAIHLATRGVAPELVQLDGTLAQLDVQATLRDETDETALVDQLESIAQAMLEGETDPLLVRELHWKLAGGLFAAAQMARHRGAADESIGLAFKADKQIAMARSPRQNALSGQVLLGGLYFLVGSQFAIAKQDHDRAVSWYTKALGPLEQPGMETNWTERGWHGERLVSMGLSFWQTGNKVRGLELTEKGILWVETAVQEDDFPRQHLAIPYGNLAVMYRALGKTEQADKFAKQAASLQASESTEVERR
jgi:tetratricopeptide (TPR) repeat protein